MQKQKKTIVVEASTEPFSVWLERRRGPAKETRQEAVALPSPLLLLCVALIASLVTSAIHVYAIPKLYGMRDWSSPLQTLHELALRSCRAVAATDTSQPKTSRMWTALCWMHDAAWP